MVKHDVGIADKKKKKHDVVKFRLMFLKYTAKLEMSKVQLSDS